jgi:hypothetical protein
MRQKKEFIGQWEEVQYHQYSVFLPKIMSDPKEINPQQLDIELGEDVAEGTYSNFAIITHSNSEFIVDFIRLMPGVPKGRVKSRIILAPQHAKRLMLALNENISRFEEVFGEIPLDEFASHGGFPLNFGGQTGQA